MSLLEAINPTARELLKTGNEPILAPEIDRTALQIMGIMEQQFNYLRSKPDHVLIELQHRCEEATMNDDASVRVAANINHAICQVVIEARGETLKRKGGPR